MDTMPRSVLQPVRRRRRRRRARGPAVMLALLVVALVATGSVAAGRHYFERTPAAAPAPRPVLPSPRLADGPMRPLPTRVPQAAKPVPRLLTGPQLVRH